MADNYLEKQYEDYQAKKAAWEWERKYGKKNKKAVNRQEKKKGTPMASPPLVIGVPFLSLSGADILHGPFQLGINTIL